MLAASYYAFSLACYIPMKLILIKNRLNNKDDTVARSEYTQFENEQDHEIIDHRETKHEKDESSV